MNESTVNENGETYSQWMSEVDYAVQSIAGVSVHDLPDFNSRDEWADGVAPLDSALMLLEEEGFPFEDALDTFHAPTDEDDGIPEWSAPFRPGTAQVSNGRVSRAIAQRRTTGQPLPRMY
jgi:hypothetical protein